LEIKGLSKLSAIQPLTEVILLKEKIEYILLKHNSQKVKILKAIGDKYIIFSKYKKDKTNSEKILKILNSFDDNLFRDLHFCAGISEIKNEDICSTIKSEIALTLAKKEGLKYFIFNSDDIRVKNTINYLEWREKTKQIVKNKAIVPYYQPIYNIKTGKIEKYEVLARALLDDQIISPFFFINHAEELGLINEITKMIILSSFEYFENKSDEFALSINLSEKDLNNYDFIEFIKDALKRFNIKPERITLEILENITFIEENEQIIKKIQELQEIGFKLAIDDFGSDNSNFSRLLNINIDYIKFDAVFIKNISKNERNKIIVKSMVSMAKVLNIKTIAEFVESEEILDIVKECGIDYAQGYFIGKPNSVVDGDNLK
jgi:EAL domain-containing protein (putative c-di-GMP-specific phosphodiesterase class I)